LQKYNLSVSLSTRSVGVTSHHILAEQFSETGESDMFDFISRVIIVASVGAVALGAVDAKPAAAAPSRKSPSVQQPADVSAARRHRHRYYGPGPGIAAVTSLFGTIAAIAAADAYRQSYAYPPGYYRYAPAAYPYAPAAYPYEEAVYPYEPAAAYPYPVASYPYASNVVAYPAYNSYYAPRVRVVGAGFGYRHRHFR
jgi:hypothetical protein